MTSLSGPGKTVVKLLSVVFLMGGLAWASVPFYTWFCQVTGFGGQPGVADVAPEEVLDQTVKVRFDASLERHMPWEFRPVERQMEIRIGDTGLAFYEAHNPTDKPVAGSAVFNVYPYEAGAFFSKIQCFCFEEQVLEPGETVQMPVTFFVDPDIVTDLDGKHVHSITLSYTFYEIDLPEGYAALETASDTTLN